MISVDVKIDDLITKDIDKIKKELKAVPKEGLKEFKALTPIDTGNARRNTYLQGNTIKADYPYAQRLDQGWSKQARRGIVEPWTKWFEKRIKQILGK